MKKSLIIMMCMALTATAHIMAQSRDITLTINVTTDTGDKLTGQAVTLVQTDYSLSYGNLTLNEEGKCFVKVYAGNHQLTVERQGYATATKSFYLDGSTTDALVSLHLTENVRQPFALNAQNIHDAYTGNNSIALQWNTEPPAFFDDFESYEPFVVEFGQWTGIDADLEAAAPIVGDYPNRCVMQYAQIINPLAVTPSWWYDYPILRPYSGKQYVGFTRTNSGNANDDWLISPTVTVGKEHSLMFMGKAADKYEERFQVYVTTVTGEPQQSDFIRLDEGNYETADYKGWKQYEYSLSKYEGKEVKFAIRYISHYNRLGSFMLMIDDVYVGQSKDYGTEELKTKAKARRTPFRSESNPNEVFHIFYDGQEIGTTEDYTYTIDNVSPGAHTIGVKAKYLAAESDITTVNVDVPGNYSKVTFIVNAESILSADGQKISLVNISTTDSYEITVTNGEATIPSLPNGQYMVNVEEGAFEGYEMNITVEEDSQHLITLIDRILTPYNITADTSEDENGQSTVTVRWNQELLFSDSFEDYDDFATGQFGGWKTVDKDQMPVYPIALGDITNVVSFPGSGTADNPQPLAPMVFNPWKTKPAMMPTDKAVAAPTGDKTIIFFSPQRVMADKWLISPPIDIREGYSLHTTMKSYDMMYLESVEFCVSTEGDNPDDFTTLSTAENIPAGQWTIYSTDLSEYQGQRVRLAVHYTSYDTFFLQLDDFTVGPENGEAVFTDYGNVIRYDIYLDGEKVAESQTPTYTLSGLSEGTHTIGITAIYKNGQSEYGTITVNITNGVATITADTTTAGNAFTLSGMKASTTNNTLPKGIYIVKQGNRYIKKAIR